MSVVTPRVGRTVLPLVTRPPGVREESMFLDLVIPVLSTFLGRIKQSYDLTVLLFMVVS